MKIIRFIAIIFFAGLIMFSGCIGDSSVDALIEDLDHENESIRSNAMDELVDMEDEKTIGSLMQIVQNENESIEMRKNAIITLGKIGDNSTTALLLNVAMEESENKQLRMASILALGDVGDKESIRSLRELSYGEDGLILYHAAYVLNQLNETYEVYGTYGELPYPLTEEQRVYRNNVGEIRSNINYSKFPKMDAVSTMFVGHVPKTGYIEVATDVNLGTSSMNEIYRIISSEAEKRGVYQVPVRFVKCGIASFA